MLILFLIFGCALFWCFVVRAQMRDKYRRCHTVQVLNQAYFTASALLFCPCAQLCPFLIRSGAKNAIGEVIDYTGLLLCICPSTLICSGRAIQAPSNSVHSASGRTALKRHRASLQ